MVKAVSNTPLKLYQISGITNQTYRLIYTYSNTWISHKSCPLSLLECSKQTDSKKRLRLVSVVCYQWDFPLSLYGARRRFSLIYEKQNQCLKYFLNVKYIHGKLLIKNQSNSSTSADKNQAHSFYLRYLQIKSSIILPLVIKTSDLLSSSSSIERRVASNVVSHTSLHVLY